MHSYSVDGSGNFTHVDSDNPGGSATGLWGVEEYIFLANGDGGLHLYRADDSGSLIHLDSDYPGGSAENVWAFRDGFDLDYHIYVACGTAGLHVYTIND